LVLTVRGRELTPRICVIGLMRSSSAIPGTVTATDR
jgi:hypothetical protein